MINTKPLNETIYSGTAASQRISPRIEKKISPRSQQKNDSKVITESNTEVELQVSPRSIKPTSNVVSSINLNDQVYAAYIVPEELTHRQVVEPAVQKLTVLLDKD